MNNNEFAEAVVYNFLTDPNVDKHIEYLKTLPMRCPSCREPGLRRLRSKSWVENWSYNGPTTLKRYICPFCNHKFIHYDSKLGCGLIPNRPKQLSII